MKVCRECKINKAAHFFTRHRRVCKACVSDILAERRVQRRVLRGPGAKKPWTAEEDEKLIHACSFHYTHDEAKALLPGRTWPAISKRCSALYLYGIHSGRTQAYNRKWQEDRISEIAKMILTGKKYEVIGEMYGVTRAAICGVVDRHIPPEGRAGKRIVRRGAAR